MDSSKPSLTSDYIFKILTYRTPTAFHRLIDSKFREENIILTRQQWGVLSVLWKKNGCTQNYIAEKIHKDKPGVTRLIDNLERIGYVKRKFNEKDRRQRLVYLTPKSLGLKEKSTDILMKAFQIAGAGIPKQKLLEFMETFEAIFQNINSYSKTNLTK